MKKQWDEQAVREESKKFSTRRQFSISRREAYLYARDNGLLDELYPRPVITLEGAKEVASRYPRMKDFRFANSSLHRRCRKNGWMDEIAKVMGQAMGPNGRRIKWTLSALQKVATQYPSLNALEQSLPGAYKAIKRNGWSDEVKPFFKSVVASPVEEPTADQVMLIARRYPYRRMFERAEPAIYAYALKENLLDKACAHMIRRWCSESVREEAKKYKSRSEFFKGSRSAYQFASKNDQLDSICWHMVRPKNVVEPKKIDVEAIKAAAASCSSRMDFRSRFSSYAKQAKDLGIYEEVCAPIAQAKIQAIRNAALCCDSKTEFRRRYQSYSKKAVELGIFDEICGHMKKKYHKIWLSRASEEDIAEFRRKVKISLEYRRSLTSTSTL